MATRPADPPRPPPGGGRGGIAENAGIEAAGRAGLAVYVAAGLSLVAALIHLWAAPEHLSEWWGYGAFFLAAATAQGLFGVVFLRWSERPCCCLRVSGATWRSSPCTC